MSDSDFKFRPSVTKPTNLFVSAFQCFLEIEGFQRAVLEQVGAGRNITEVLQHIVHSGIIPTAGLVFLTFVSSATLRHHVHEIFDNTPIGRFGEKAMRQFRNFAGPAMTDSKFDLTLERKNSGNVIIQAHFLVWHFHSTAVLNAIRIASSTLLGDGSGPRLAMSPIGVEKRDLHLVVFARAEDVAWCKETILNLLATHARSSIEFDVTTSAF